MDDPRSKNPVIIKTNNIMTTRKKLWFTPTGSSWSEKGSTYTQATFSGFPVSKEDPRSGIEDGVNDKIYTIIWDGASDKVDAPNPPFETTEEPD